MSLEKWVKWYAYYLVKLYQILQISNIYIPTFNDFCKCLYEGTDNKNLDPCYNESINLDSVHNESLVNQINRVGSLEEVEELYYITLEYIHDSILYIFNGDTKYDVWLKYFKYKTDSDDDSSSDVEDENEDEDEILEYDYYSE
jgi:hypothetical protein